jgi:hypothetical protein
MTRSGVGHPDRMAPSLSSYPKLGLPSVQSFREAYQQRGGVEELRWLNWSRRRPGYS